MRTPGARRPGVLAYLVLIGNTSCMTDAPVPIHQKVEDMEAANNERIQSLAAGTNGLPVQFPPNTMETMKLLVYMETLLDSNGMLNKAKYRFHKELADVLDAVEEQSRIAKLTHGTGTFQA